VVLWRAFGRNYPDRYVIYKGGFMEGFWENFVEGEEFAGKPIEKYKPYLGVGIAIKELLEEQEVGRVGWADYAIIDMIDVQVFIYLTYLYITPEHKHHEYAVEVLGDIGGIGKRGAYMEDNGMVTELEGVAKVLKTKRQIILYGPPGTSKTWLAEKVVNSFAYRPESDTPSGYNGELEVTPGVIRVLIEAYKSEEGGLYENIPKGEDRTAFIASMRKYIKAFIDDSKKSGVRKYKESPLRYLAKELKHETGLSVRPWLKIGQFPIWENYYDKYGENEVNGYLRSVIGLLESLLRIDNADECDTRLQVFINEGVPKTGLMLGALLYPLQPGIYPILGVGPHEGAFKIGIDLPFMNLDEYINASKQFRNFLSKYRTDLKGTDLLDVTAFFDWLSDSDIEGYLDGAGELLPEPPVGLLGATGLKEKQVYESAEVHEADFDEFGISTENYPGGEAWWWSFRIKDEFTGKLDEALRKEGFFYFYATVKGSKVVSRSRIINYVTAEPGQLIESPWPEKTAPELRNITQISDKQPEQFRTWFLVDRYEVFYPAWDVSGLLNIEKDRRFKAGDIRPTAFNLVREITERGVLQSRPVSVQADTGKKRSRKVYEIVQFHPSYTYEDFVRGLVAKPRGSGVSFEPEDKIFARMCTQASENPDRSFFLIIDEINRADISKVFGELIYGLEYRDERVETPYEVNGSTALAIPPNLYIIGTMNTADKSIAMLDYALRRRFAFIPMYPDETVIGKYYAGELPETEDAARNLFKKVKECFDPKAGRDLQVGHTYFMVGEKKDGKIRAPGEAGELVEIDDARGFELLGLKFIYETAPIIHEYILAGEEGVTAPAIENAYRRKGSGIIAELKEVFDSWVKKPVTEEKTGEYEEPVVDSEEGDE
jgi:MoxR-like ATPase